MLVQVEQFNPSMQVQLTSSSELPLPSLRESNEDSALKRRLVYLTPVEITRMIILMEILVTRMIILIRNLIRRITIIDGNVNEKNDDIPPKQPCGQPLFLGAEAAC